MAFPTAPSWFGNASPSTRSGVYYQGAGTVPTFTLSKSGATAYSVRDYYGTVVSTGTVGGLTVTPTSPAGGWLPGWYRIYFTGPNTDAAFGNSYAVSNFVVLRDDPRFPALPASTSVTYYGDEQADPPLKGLLGLGHSRHKLDNYSTPNSGTNTLTVIQSHLALSRAYWSQPTNPLYVDAARPRPLWVSTPGPCVDSLTVAGASSGNFLTFYAKTGGVDSSQVFVATAPGTSSGSKVTISFPNAGTVVETYDNLASGLVAEAAINAASAYVKVFSKGAATVATTTATAIGRTTWNGIVTVVQALYPDIAYYEFTNEPQINAEVAHQCLLFTAAVHAGNAGAKSMGPCPVDIVNLPAWRLFLAAGGGSNVDVLSFHDYSSMRNANPAQFRGNTVAWVALLTEFGVAGKERWQTEAGAAFSAVAGVLHPRRARVKILHTLLWEQFGVPRERNPMWYDRSHGFWAFPAFWQYGDSTLTADGPLHRTLAEETFGMVHAEAHTFGRYGDATLVSSRYAGSGGQVVAVQAGSTIPGATVSYTTSAAGPLTVVDAFGNTTTTTVTGGVVTLPLGEVPTYLRLPVGATCTPLRVNDWPTVAQQASWANTAPQAVVRSGSDRGGGWYVNDGRWSDLGTYYGFGADSPGNGDSGMPDSVTLAWPTATRMDRVIIWAGPVYSGDGTLTDFDVQTSNDGTTWTTRATVTRPATSFLFGSGSQNAWGSAETYWDEQWVFDVKLAAPLTVKYLRISVRDVSYGGEPDWAALQAGGQGWNKRIALQDVAVLCEDNLNPQFVRQ